MGKYIQPLLTDVAALVDSVGKEEAQRMVIDSGLTPADVQDMANRSLDGETADTLAEFAEHLRNASTFTPHWR